MNKLLITICFLAGLTMMAQASPSLFKMPNAEDIEKLREEWFGGDQQQEQRNFSSDDDDEDDDQQQNNLFGRNNNGNNNNSQRHRSRTNTNNNQQQQQHRNQNQNQNNNNDNQSSRRNNQNQNQNSVAKDSSEDFSGEDTPAAVSNLKRDANKFADSTIQKLKAKIVDNALNDIALPSESRQFRRRFYGITYHGEALLSHGYLKGFDNIRRIGDASMHGHTNGSSTLVFETEFNNIEVGYTLEISFMMQKIPSQKVKGYLNGVTAQIEVLVDKNGKVMMTDFDITDSGHFRFQTTGLGSFNFLLDRIVDAVGNLSKRFVLESMEGKIRLLLNAILNNSVYPVNALFASVQNDLFTKFSNAVARVHG